jgi:hypothetical protein
MEGGFMIGLPHETQASWRETVEWLKRKDCPLDISTVYPLNIVKKSDRNQWFPTSWFDNNYEQFGYTFPKDGVEGMLYWEKEDTDIRNFFQAQEIADATTLELKPYQHIRQGDFYTSSHSHPILKNREHTLDMTADEYKTLIGGIDFEDLFHKSVTEEYFTKLINKLRNV